MAATRWKRAGYIIVSLYVGFHCTIDLSVATIRAQKFKQKMLCNVTVSPSRLEPRLVSRLLCGAECSIQDACFAYAFSAGVCRMYPWDVLVEKECSDGRAGAVGVFVKEHVCQNGGQRDLNNKCVCIAGYMGLSCERVIEDCTDGYRLGFTADDIYWIKPKLAPAAFQVRCQMSTGLGLTRIQMRFRSNYSFNRTWQEYKQGFSLDSREDFWLGNHKIHWITSSFPHTLIVQLSNSTHSYQRHHHHFLMANEGDNYAVTYNASWVESDPLQDIDPCWPGSRIQFSTYDADNDDSPNNCASLYGVGFWLHSSNCSLCNPNGQTHPGQNVAFNMDQQKVSPAPCTPTPMVSARSCVHLRAAVSPRNHASHHSSLPATVVFDAAKVFRFPSHCYV